MELWETIDEFPDYEVSSRGLIVNKRSGRLMAQNINQHGIVHVGLVKDGVQYRRSVAGIVARTFKPTSNRRFNTPVHLDGNREHNFVENLVWRPRPFAISYYRQFRNRYRYPVNRPIEIIQSGEPFEDSWQPCVKYGLLERAVVMSVLNRIPVFPTGDIFRLLDK